MVFATSFRGTLLRLEFQVRYHPVDKLNFVKNDRGKLAVELAMLKA